MIRLDFFRALAATGRCPGPTGSFAVGGIPYDLPLPMYVAASLTELLSEAGPFKRVDDYCNPERIAEVRADPSLLGPAASYPFYATAEVTSAPICDPVYLSGRCQFAVASKQTAAEIARFAVEGYPFTPDVRDWLLACSPLLTCSGGFEIARFVFAYLDVDVAVENRRPWPAFLEPVKVDPVRRRRTRFRDVLARGRARSIAASIGDRP